MTKAVVTPETIEEIQHQLDEFSKNNFGKKFGDDFPDVAQALLKTQAFKSHLAASVALSILDLATKAPEVAMMNRLSPELGKRAADVLLENSPIKGVLADLFYLGFKVGVAFAEVRSLEDMSK